MAWLHCQPGKNENFRDEQQILCQVKPEWLARNEDEQSRQRSLWKTDKGTAIVPARRLWPHRSRDSGARASHCFQESCQKSGILWEICILWALNIGHKLETKNVTCLQTLSGHLRPTLCDLHPVSLHILYSSGAPLQ